MFALRSVLFSRAAQVAVGLGIQLWSEWCNGTLQNCLTFPEAGCWFGHAGIQEMECKTSTNLWINQVNQPNKDLNKISDFYVMQLETLKWDPMHFPQKPTRTLGCVDCIVDISITIGQRVWQNVLGKAIRFHRWRDGDFGNSMLSSHDMIIDQW